MQLHELPAGTRVVYAGLTKDGENDADKVGDSQGTLHAL